MLVVCCVQLAGIFVLFQYKLRVQIDEVECENDVGCMFCGNISRGDFIHRLQWLDGIISESEVFSCDFDVDELGVVVDFNMAVGIGGGGEGQGVLQKEEGFGAVMLGKGAEKGILLERLREALLFGFGCPRYDVMISMRLLAGIIKRIENTWVHENSPLAK